MRSTRSAWLCGLLGVLLTACGGRIPRTDDDSGRVQEPVIRATAQGGRDQVVLLYIAKRYPNGGVYRTTCSGTYFAPRVVMTAAHCLKDSVADETLVYWGDDFVTDAARLGSGLYLYWSIPPVGQPSNWARADSVEIHPQYDRDLHYPDLAIAYLDRKPPFDPIPLARFRLDDAWIGKQVTITGWGGDEATSAVTATGIGVQRTGVSRILGSPTEEDYHADDPNGGMLDPNVRKDIVKIDGTAPYSSECFGDSGSPILLNRWGQDYAAGVEYFGGLWCEQYALVTRIDPFLPFFDEAYRKGGQATLIPRVECVGHNLDGTLTAYFGYDNQNGVSLTVPPGAQNSFPLDTASRRPTKFLPGFHRFAFGVDFASEQELVYKLSPENSPTTELRVNSRSPACSGADVLAAECGDNCRSFLRSGCADLLGFNDCLSDCMATGQGAPICAAEYGAYLRCYAHTPAGEGHWACVEGYPWPFSTDCSDLENAFYTCAWGL